MKKAIALASFLVAFMSASGSHILGGNTSYRCVSGNTYEFTVNMYFDYPSIAYNCELYVDFGDGSGLDTLHCVNGPSVDCSPYGDGILINNSVRYCIFKTLHTYPGPGSYYISMSIPNRHAGILNIPNSVNALFGLEARIIINPLFGPGNNSCTLDDSISLDTAYAGLYHQFNAHATDADGDSLVYQLMGCMYVSNYTLPFASLYFGCDTLSGIVEWAVPDTTGYFSYCARIYEYRMVNNQYYLVGYTMRDIFAVVQGWNGINEPGNGGDVLVYPVPSAGEVNITLPGREMSTDIHLGVTDITGKIIPVTYTIKDEKFVIYSNGLSPGLYFFLLSDAKGYLRKGRFEIVR